jgi:hypothetical protein
LSQQTGVFSVFFVLSATNESNSSQFGGASPQIFVGSFAIDQNWSAFVWICVFCVFFEKSFELGNFV